jgi:hypothetical protein
VNTTRCVVVYIMWHGNDLRPGAFMFQAMVKPSFASRVVSDVMFSFSLPYGSLAIATGIA